MTKNYKATPIKHNFYEKLLFIVLFCLCAQEGIRSAESHSTSFPQCTKTPKTHALFALYLLEMARNLSLSIYVENRAPFCKMHFHVPNRAEKYHEDAAIVVDGHRHYYRDIAADTYSYMHKFYSSALLLLCCAFRS